VDVLVEDAGLVVVDIVVLMPKLVRAQLPVLEVADMEVTEVFAVMEREWNIY